MMPNISSLLPANSLWELVTATATDLWQRWTGHAPPRLSRWRELPDDVQARVATLLDPRDQGALMRAGHAERDVLLASSLDLADRCAAAGWTPAGPQPPPPATAREALAAGRRALVNAPADAPRAADWRVGCASLVRQVQPPCHGHGALPLQKLTTPLPDGRVALAVSEPTLWTVNAAGQATRLHRFAHRITALATTAEGTAEGTAVGLADGAVWRSTGEAKTDGTLDFTRARPPGGASPISVLALTGRRTLVVCPREACVVAAGGADPLETPLDTAGLGVLHAAAMSGPDHVAIAGEYGVRRVALAGGPGEDLTYATDQSRLRCTFDRWHVASLAGDGLVIGGGSRDAPSYAVDLAGRRALLGRFALGFCVTSRGEVAWATPHGLALWTRAGSAKIDGPRALVNKPGCGDAYKVLELLPGFVAVLASRWCDDEQSLPAAMVVFDLDTRSCLGTLDLPGYPICALPGGLLVDQSGTVLAIDLRPAFMHSAPVR